MKKIIFALAILVASSTFISCTADSLSDDASMNLSADDTGGGGGGTLPPITPPPPIKDPKL